jgi:hypothetical protein
VAVWLAILAACATLAVSEGAITGSDGRGMYEVGKSFVEHGRLSVDPSFGVQGRQGLYYSKYGPGLPAVAAVAIAAVRPVARHTRFPDLVEQASAASTMPIICGLLVAAIYLLSRRLGGGPGPAALTALGAVAGTLLLPYSKEFFSEPLTALFLTVSIERAIARRHTAAGLAAAAAALTRPQAFAFVPLLAWVVWKEDRWLGLRSMVAPLALGVAATCGYNVVRFGNPLEFGYRAEKFSTPFFTGAAGLLFTADKSIFLFAPIVILFPQALTRLFAKAPSAFWLICGNLALTFVIAASWKSWSGGWNWGPRLLIVGITPAIAAVGAWCDGSRRRRNCAAALFLLGSLVSAPAMIVSTRAQQLDDPPPVVGPSVFRQYQLIAPTAASSVRHLYEYNVGMNRQYINLWQVSAARVMGRKGLLLAVLVSAGLLVLIGISVRSLRRIFEGLTHVTLPT